MDPMDRIRDLLGRITDLSDQELTELRDLVLGQVNNIDDGDGDSPGDTAPPDDTTLAVMSELNSAVGVVNDEIARRNDAYSTAAQFAAAKSGGVAELSTATATAPDGSKVEATVPDPASADKSDDDKPEGTDDPTDKDGDAKPEGDGGEGSGDGVTAGGKVPPAKTPVQAPEDRRPKPNVVTPTQVITAAADVQGYAMGQEITDPLQLGDAMCRRIESLKHVRGRGGDDEQVVVASIRLDGVPDERHLAPGQPESNYAKVMEVVKPKAMVAAGGVTTMVDTRYDLFGGGVTDRPVQAALPSFTADRGGIRFITPPTLAQLSGAVGLWTVQDDEDAALPDDPDATPAFVSPTKPVLRVDAGDEVTVHTQAVTVGLVFGNMQARAYPELVARHNDLAMVAHARIAEQQLLAQIGALSLKVKSPNQVAGAARTVLVQVDKALAAYRNRYRIGAVPVRLIFPTWFKDLLRADLVLQMPGDGPEMFALADAMINQWFTARGANVTWALDGEAGQDYGPQTDGTVGAPATLQGFPTHVVWYLFAEGTFLFLDGGTLDLGIVRDSTLNAKNDYQTFVETFEAVAKVGYEGLRVDSPIAPSGAAAALAAVAPGVV